MNLRIFALNLLILASTTTGALAHADGDTQRAFDIPAQPLAQALRQFADQTGLQLAFETALTTGRTSPEVKGELSTDEALMRLLKGTGLRYDFLDDRTVAVSSAAEKSISKTLPISGSNASFSTSEEKAPGSTRRMRLAQAGNQKTDRPSDKKDEPQDTKLEEIIVTATKRQERLINVPQSVSVLSAADLTKLGATQFRDFASSVPGLTFTTQGAGNTQVSLRGVTAGVDSSSTVGIYVDDVPYGSSTPFALAGRFAFDAGLFDMERIEVLRGPQGTLYGASTMGGLLKYVTRQPDAESFGVDAYTGISNTRDGSIGYNGALVVNAPLANDKAALRVSVFESHDGGYIDNLARSQKDVNRSDVYGARADLMLTPTDALNIRLVAFAQNIERDGEGTAEYALPGGTSIDGDLEQRRGFAEQFEQRFRLVSGTLAYALDRASLTSISSYQTSKTLWPVDLTTQYAPILQAFLGRSYSAVADRVDLITDKFTQEVRLASAGTAPLEWLVGVFYTRESSEDNEQFLLRNLAGAPALNDLFFYSAPTRYTECAGFANLTWHFTGRFDVTGGLRYAHTGSEFTQIGSGIFGLSAPTTDVSDNVITYLANARYHFNDHATAYLRYATGYRPGGPAIVTSADPTASPTFDADRLKSYEGGIKAETADRRFAIEVAGYYIDWSDIQLFTTNAGGFGTFTNAPGGADIQGAELTLIARPTDDFTLTGAFAYQDAQLSQADAILGGRKGEQLPNVPDLTATLNGDYVLPVQDRLRPTIGATVRYVSDRESSFDNSQRFPQHRLPEYTTVDLRVGMTLGSVDTRIYLRNLFDERGQLSAFTQFGTARVGILQPRTIGINATVHF